MPQIAIMAAITVGASVAQYFLRPKTKLGKVDRGRADDTRIQTVEEGGFVPICYGRRVRLAGLGIWSTPTYEHITTTPGRSGGKGGGGSPPEPATDNFSYTKSFALLICDALPGGLNGRLRKIWEDTEVIYNAVGVDGYNGFLEAEAATLASGAVRANDTQCSGGQRVSLPTGAASVQFNAIDGPGAVDVTLYYVSSSSATLDVLVNGTLATTLSLTSSAGAVGTKIFSLTLPSLSNTVRLQNASASLSIDRIQFRAAGSDLPIDTLIPTARLNPGGTFPADPNNPVPFYNTAPVVDPTTGVEEGTLVAGGQVNFEFFPGTENQPQSSVMVAADGAANVSAYRGSTVIVFDTYQLKNGASVGNMSFEIDPGMSNLADVMVDLYKRTKKLAAADVDMTALSGLTVETLIIDSADGLSSMIDSLQLWYNFDVIDRGGKIVAVLRGGSSSDTITDDDLAAYDEGGQRPLGPVVRTHQPGIDIPGLANVSFIDPRPGKDFHTTTVPAIRTTGTSVEPVDLNFPLGGNDEEAVQVGLRYLFERELAKDPFEFTTGPKFSHKVPTDIVTLALASATHIVRLTQVQAALTGLVKMRAVPEKTSIYTQTRSPIWMTGFEPSPVDVPANTYLWLGDLPPLRLEDDALGYYVGVCKRGAGAWRGAHLNKEEITGAYDRVTGFDRPAMIGIVVSAPAAVTDPTQFDRTGALVVDFFIDDGSLESRPEADILARPLNVLVAGSGQNMGVFQYATATPSAASSPYVIRYTFTTLLHGRNNTEYAIGQISAGQPVVILNDDLKFRRESTSEVGATRNYKAISVGQAEPDAPVTSFLFNGNSLKPPPPLMRGTRNTALDLLVELSRVARLAPGLRAGSGVPLAEEVEIYELEFYSGSTLKRTRRILGPTVEPATLLDRSNKSAAGTVTFSRHISEQRIDPESSYVMANVAPNGIYEPSVGLVDNAITSMVSDGAGGTLFNPPWLLTFYFAASNIPTIFENGASVYTGSAYADTTANLRLELKNGRLHYFLNYENESSLPVYISTRTDFNGRDLRAYFGADNGTTNQRVLMGRRFYNYTAAEQTADLGSTQPSIKVKGYQISAIVGRGRARESML